MNNYCHNNNSSGIAIVSSKVELIANECWENKYFGILIISQSSGLLINNRCHKNLYGIEADSSKVDLIGNECWENKSHGIKLSSKLKITIFNNNYSHNNTSGIGCSTTKVRGIGNEFWKNVNQEIYLEKLNDGDVLLYDHFLPPLNKQQQQLESYYSIRPLGQWLMGLVGNKKNGQHEYQAEALADFLQTGCNHCFKKFWNFNDKNQLQNAVEHDKPSHQGGIYSFGKKQDQQDTTIHLKRERDCTSDEPIGQMQWVIDKFKSCYTSYKLKHKDRKGKRLLPPRWSLALVTGESSDILNPVINNSDEQIHIHQLSLQQGASDEVVPLLVKQLLKKNNSRFKSVLLGMKNNIFTIMTSIIGILFLISVSLLGYSNSLYNQPAKESKIQTVDKIKHLEKSNSKNKKWVLKDEIQPYQLWKTAIFSFNQWSSQSLSAFGLQLLIFVLVVLSFLLVLVNRQIPKQIHIKIPWISGVLDTIDTSGPLKFLVNFILKKSLNESNYYHWLTNQIYGVRWFGFNKKTHNLVILIIEHVEVIHEKDKKLLQTIISNAPVNQGILIIIQMQGLSLLNHTFFDLWKSKNSPENLNKTSLLYDPLSFHIEAVGSLKKLTQDERNEKRRQLGQIMGWDQELAKLRATFNTLTNEKANINDIAVQLMLGTTHHVSMKIQRQDEDITEDDLWKENLEQQLNQYASILGNQIKISPVNIDVIEQRYQMSNGYMLVGNDNNQGEQNLQWLAHLGYRKQMVSLLRDLFNYDNKNSELYINKLIAGGERYHLGKAKQLFSDTKSEDLKLLPLHLMAAFYLLQERHQLDKQHISKLSLIEDWVIVWNELANIKINREIESYSKTAIGQSISSIIAGIDLYSLNLSNPAKEVKDIYSLIELEITQLIDIPLKLLGSKPDTFWDIFKQDIQQTLYKLIGYPKRLSNRILKNRLSQEWLNLPNKWKLKLENGRWKDKKQLEKVFTSIKSEKDLLQRIRQFNKRPAFIISNLGVLAMQYLRTTFHQDKMEKELYEENQQIIASALYKLRPMSANSG